MDVHRVIRVARLLLQLNVLVGLCGSSATIAAALLVGATPSLAGAVAAFAVVFGVYNFDRLADTSPAEGRSTPERAATVRRTRRWLGPLIALCLGLAVVLGWRHGPQALAWTLTFPALGVAYSLPLLPVRGMRRIKDIPYFKGVYTAACWTTFVGVGLAYAGVQANVTTARFVVFLGLRAFVSAFLGDIRDAEDDTEAGIPTIAAALGVEQSHRLLYALHAVAASVLVSSALTGSMPIAALALLGPMLIGVGLQRTMHRRPEAQELVNELYDFEWALYGLAVAAGTLLLPT